MNNYNAAFFGLFENVFKLLKEEYGEEKALEHFTTLMERGLSKSYGSDFKKGDPKEFERLVAERDRLVGLRVEFPKMSEDEFIYQFHGIIRRQNICGMEALIQNMSFTKNSIQFEDYY